MAIGLTLALATTALGAGKSILGHMGQQKSYRAKKRAAKKQFNAKRMQLLANHRSAIAQVREDNRIAAEAYTARINQGHAQVKFNNQYAADVYSLRQQKLNDAFAAQAFADQDRAVRLAQAQGQMAAAGRTGVTAGRFDIANIAQAGRNQAIAAREMTGRIAAFDKQSEIDNRKFAHQNYLVGQQTAIQPRFGRAPTMPLMPLRPDIPNPGNIGLLTGLAGAAMSGISTYGQFAPKTVNLKFDK